MPSADTDPTLRMSGPTPSGRRRPSPPTLAAAVAAALAAAALGISLLADDGMRVRTEEQGTTVPTTATVVSTTTSVAGASTTVTAPATTVVSTPPRQERLSAESRLSLDGIGPVDVGMTLAEASEAAGMPIRTKPGDPYGPECEYAYPAQELDDVAFMVFNGRIARVDVGHRGSGRVRTVSGVGIGSTEEEVSRTYPGRIRVEGHPYVPTGHYLVYTPADPNLQHLGMIFETDGKVVTSFRSGRKDAVGQIEGCS
jgi:hypothetical protein